MSHEEIDDFAGADAGGALTYPIRAGEVKKGMTVILKGKFCEVFL